MIDFANDPLPEKPTDSDRGLQQPQAMTHSILDQLKASSRFNQLETTKDLAELQNLAKGVVLEWNKLRDINALMIHIKFGRVSSEQAEVGVVEDCARRIASGSLAIDDALDEIGVEDLTFSRQFDVERFQRVIDMTEDGSNVLNLAKQVLEASYTQRAAIQWILRQGDDSWVVPSDLE